VQKRASALGSIAVITSSSYTVLHRWRMRAFCEVVVLFHAENEMTLSFSQQLGNSDLQTQGEELNESSRQYVRTDT
jgi:hypothetical protein